MQSTERKKGRLYIYIYQKLFAMNILMLSEEYGPIIICYVKNTTLQKIGTYSNTGK